jgi:putative lipoic acid-binding regulatory protein
MVTVVKDTKFDEFLEFPCAFTFKVLGVAHEDLVSQVIATLQQHAGANDYAPSVKPSSKGNYHSVSVSVVVRDKDHIELLYTELGRLELVRYVM